MTWTFIRTREWRVDQSESDSVDSEWFYEIETKKIDSNGLEYCALLVNRVDMSIPWQLSTKCDCHIQSEHGKVLCIAIELCANKIVCEKVCVAWRARSIGMPYAVEPWPLLLRRAEQSNKILGHEIRRNFSPKNCWWVCCKTLAIWVQPPTRIMDSIGYI